MAMDSLPAPQQLQWNAELVSRFWGWQSQFPETYFTYQFGDRIAARLRGLIGPGNNVLDYGCGTGFLCRHLGAFGAQVWATDVSEESVAATNRLNAGAPGFQGAVVLEAMVNGDRRFDRIVSVEVIEHLDDATLPAYFAAIRALSAPGGLVVITTPNDENLAASEIYCPCCNHTLHRWQHVRSFSAETLASTVRAHGLEPVRVFTTDFSRRPWRQPVNTLRQWAKRLLGRTVKQPHLVCIARVAG